MAIKRTFQDIPEGKLSEADQQSFLISLGWSRADGWQELLRSKRVMIISEAGGGKTYECRAQCRRLWEAGEPAFFLELATLASSDVRSMLDPKEELRLDAWLASQSDVATFFLDSVDELKLSRGSFEQAMKRLSKGIAGKERWTRIVVTTRPIPFDGQLIQRLLRVPQTAEIEIDVNGEMFAQVAMNGRVKKQEEGQKDDPADWRTVALMPLSDTQIEEFARSQGVGDPKALAADLQRRNAQEFARRPQDLIELCADWRDFKRIRTHCVQVASNIRIKLKPREDRPEPAELAIDKAIEGAGRLALALMVTRCLTIRHSAEADLGGQDVALDPSAVLSDWSPDERKALLERSLFGFASYGRVRFHHRSVAEYLAAERIRTLRTHGMPAKALHRLLFARTRDKIIVRPSKRAIAGWLALTDNMIFETLRDCEPAVLLTEGDPESLAPLQRSQALRAYVERYGQGGWRGLNVPHIQIHRFASAELAPEIKRLWAEGIENPEIREMLLQLIDSGRIRECSAIAEEAAIDAERSSSERLVAIEALAALDDPTLGTITAEMADDETLWPADLARGVVLRLFPKHLNVTRFCVILARLHEDEGSLGSLSWQLAPLIAGADLDEPELEAVRDGLHDLVSVDLGWQNEWSSLVCSYPHLSAGLAATCVRGLNTSVTEEWLRVSALAVRLPQPEDGNNEAFVQLRKLLSELPAKKNAALFWLNDELLQSIHPTTDSWKRYARIARRGTVTIDPARDWEWIKADLADCTRPKSDRAMLLEAGMRLAPSREEWRDHIIGLRSLVADQPELLAVIDERLKPSKEEKENRRWEIREAKRRKQQEQKKEEAHTSWVAFWKEVAERPETAFSHDQAANTAWHLWHVMRKAGDESRASGWNRRFIETHFGKATADRLRLTLMIQWRNDRPTLESERPSDGKNSYLVRWQLGLAAIYAEAEDSQWAVKLSEEEAKLAVRYALIELNSLPSWMEALVKAHPAAVDSILGQELSLELESAAHPQWHSMLLQKIGNAPEAVVAVFLPRLRQWLDANADGASESSEETGAAQRLQQIVYMLKKHGGSDTQLHLCTLARRRLGEKLPPSFARLWLQLLMHFDAGAGIDALEDRIRTIRPERWSEAVTLFGTLFGSFFGGRHGGVNLADPQFTPPILLRLLRLSHRHVRPEDDVKHQGAYSPDDRDHAERLRDAIVSILLKSSGEEGWAAKVEMAADPCCSHFRDRILAVAEEQWAEEVDAAALDQAQAIALDKTGEAPPSTNEAMFDIMVDRLDDLDDQLLRDDSPREAWAGIIDEKIMRRAIARELNHSAKGLYKIDQEAATADEKETDIRLRSVASDHEGIIELKLADGRTAEDLRETLSAQLVTKYMASEKSRSGCLLITLAKDRKWEHPDNGSRIGFPELIALLREEAANIVERLGGALRLHVHPLDLRPRLKTEATQTKAKKAGKKPR